MDADLGLGLCWRLGDIPIQAGGHRLVDLGPKGAGCGSSLLPRLHGQIQGALIEGFDLIQVGGNVSMSIHVGGHVSPIVKRGLGSLGQQLLGFLARLDVEIQPVGGHQRSAPRYDLPLRHPGAEVWIKIVLCIFVAFPSSALEQT